MLAITGLPIPPEHSKPTTPTPSRAVGCLIAEKAPHHGEASGAKSAMWAAEPWRTHGNPHRDTTTETVAARGGDMRTAPHQGSARSAARRFGFLPSSVLRLPSPAHGIRPKRRRHCSRSKDATSIPTGGYCHIITCGEIGADAACTSAFPSLDCVTVEADQTPNAVAATIAKR
jgi:hypothetical protein